MLRDRLRDLRRDYVRPADSASRTAYEPGELCDLRFQPADIPLGFGQAGSPPVVVMVSRYSRWITARMLPTRSAADLIARHWRLLTGLGAVAKVLIWENEEAVGSTRTTPSRIRAARFPSLKSLEDFDHQRYVKGETINHLGTLDFVAGKANVILLGPPGTGKTHLATGLGIRACQAGH